MSVQGFFQNYPTSFLVTVTILGLIIGSFLNVVIYRLPIMLKTQWNKECKEWLGMHDPAANTSAQPFNLITPRSRCPACGHQINALENIPILSYVVLRGRCAACKTPIPIQYPLVEALTGALSLLVAWHFGYSWQTAAALVLTWVLIALSVIDLQTKLLPDAITVPFLWVGILVNMEQTFTDLTSSVLGAVFGYLSLWSIYRLFKLVTGKEGMGYGDFKLLALFGAWLGWQSLPLIIILSSLVGAVAGISLIAFKGQDRNSPIPFGPYLATAGWIAMLWGQGITQSYLEFTVG